MTILKLGVTVKDSATKTEGMLTHFLYSPNSQCYIYQPKLVNPETGLPASSIVIDAARVENGKLDDVDLPLEIINTEVKDKATGIEGKAIGLVYHINGCVHIEFQPKGRVEKTGAPIKTLELDIRRLEGKAIPKMTDAELKADQKKNPSPAPRPARWENI
jgi:hypothetical protein